MINSLTFRCEGNKVLILSGGVCIAVAPWQAADEMAKAITAKAREAEQNEKINDVVFDHAILTRAGFPLGLTSNPKAMEEVKKETAWNRTLRCSGLKGIKSETVVGAPGLIQHKPTKRAG